MDRQKLIILTFIVVVAMVVAINVWSWLTAGFEDTVSANLSRWGKQWLIIPLAIGVVIGHCFNSDKQVLAVLILGVALGAVFW